MVAFSEAVSPSTAANKNNYTINNGVTVNSATVFGNNFTVVLSTTPIAAGQEYTLTVNGVQARGGTINAAGPVVAGGMVFVPSGYSELGNGVRGNVLLAFGVQ